MKSTMYYTRTNLNLGKAANEQSPPSAHLVHDGGERMQPTQHKFKLERVSGFSIVEAMIAILISMIMLAGVLQIFITSKTVNSLEVNFNEIQENARFATTYMSRIIRLAGYRTPPSANSKFQSFDTIFPTSAPFMAGANGTGANGSDTLTVRYQGSGNGAGVPDGTVRDCLNNAVDSNVVATSIFSITSNNELQCQAINPSASPNNSTQILVTGVENMQVLYGEDVDRNGTADRYVSASFPSLDMSRVVSIRVNLLFRSSDAVDLTPTSTTYNLNGQAYTPTNNTFLRHHVTFTTTLRNLISDPF